MPPAVLLRRLLLLPLLAPLLAVLLVGALNPRPWVSLRLLIWRTPEWTIGSWLALAAGAGGALSGTATALALQASATSSRRQLHLPIADGRSRRVWPWGRGVSAEEGASAAWVDGPGQEPGAAWGRNSQDAPEAPWPGQAWAGPSRHPTEPPPTLSVPFRVIRRGTAPVADAGTAPYGTRAAGARTVDSNGWDPAGPQPASETAEPGTRQGLWPRRNRRQAQPVQGPTGSSAEDPDAVDRSWQQDSGGDW